MEQVCLPWALSGVQVAAISGWIGFVLGAVIFGLIAKSAATRHFKRLYGIK